ncbi:MAG: hypothetical protein ACNA7Z_01170 [Dethiobacteria bacterium]
MTLLIFIYTGKPFTTALIGAFSSATVIFLSWAVGRELDPANEWSAFIALPLLYFAYFTAGSPSLLVLLFIILSCRLINRTIGLQPFRSDSLLLVMLSALLYFNSLYFALPYLILIFLIDALTEPANRFQLVSALAGSAGYLVLLIVLRPELSLFMPETVPVIYPAAAVVLVVLSVICISCLTRHDRVLDDLNKVEVNYHRVAAARLLVAAWIVTEILCSGVISLLQIYPVVIIFGSILLYHLIRIIISKLTLGVKVN